MEPVFHTIPLTLPRHAVSPRQVARGGDVWRLFQEAAVIASERLGWPAQRFVDEGVGFIVSRMTVAHEHEIEFGIPLEAKTWIRDFRRGVLSKREVRLHQGGQPVARATQQWVHVAAGARGPGGELLTTMTPARASDDLIAAFAPLETDESSVQLPEVLFPVESAPHHFQIEVWHTWMDPLAHVNHPAYLDWCDEATCRQLTSAGLNPQMMVPVAEELRYKRGLSAGTRVNIETRIVGQTERGHVVLRHRVDTEDGLCAVEATTVRKMIGPKQPDWSAVFA
jgi:acyl-CoA thioesterase FadM